MMWPEDESDGIGECCICKKQTVIRYLKDPYYIEGIHTEDGDDEDMAFCEPCYDRRWDDV